ncbi:uncharacterized protein UV8b_05173 [Ustilaginoidea virens]|uniref:WSC domain-containing protein n=1 Tax=Ustilaginoidea virens TaxID=1159556 RepID=A0A8E5MIT8_USTVR|nr:uncharacterized protein UV8b_05173 [Ustilaginoidea virens]QUC20932.1 hypothetical protein UV8b_05173 [Ustilaginoidea virens]
MDWKCQRLFLFLQILSCLLVQGVVSSDSCSDNALVKYQPLQVLCQGSTYTLTGAYTSLGCTSATAGPGTGASGTTGTGPGVIPSNTPTCDAKCQLPSQLVGFTLYGCAVSRAGFPGFVKVATSRSMDLGTCAAVCTTRFIGVYQSDCYCGDVLDASLTVADPSSCTCNIPCPGNSQQCCGGASPLGLKLKRQLTTLATIALTLYQRTSASSMSSVGRVIYTTTNSLGSDSYVTIYQPVGGSVTAPTTITIPPSGTNPGSVVIVTPPATGDYLTLTQPFGGSITAPTTMTILPSGTRPGSVIILTPPGTGAYVTVTQPYSGSLTVPTTFTIPATGTIPGSVVIITPPVTSLVTVFQPFSGSLTVPTTFTIPPSGTNPGSVRITYSGYNLDYPPERH